MKKKPSGVLVIAFFSSCLVIVSGCSSECSGIKTSSADTYSQAVEEFERASKVFEAAKKADSKFGPNQKLVPYRDSNGREALLVTDKPILDDYFKLRRVWLTIQVNNPGCFDARSVAEAEIELGRQ